MPAFAAIIDAYTKKPAAAAATANGAGAGGKGGGAANGGAPVAGASGSFDIDLEGAEMGKVVTRFPPEPSGYLHIGHAKAAILNQTIANLYKGKLLVRFDDTNPSKEKDEYVENIIADIKRLGLEFEKITYTSDYFPQMVELAYLMIKKGDLYADDTPVDQMREERMHGIESQRRNSSVEDTLAAFEEMQKGSDAGIKYCLRVKMDMTAGNKALRDPVVFRCNPTHHWRTGHTYKCYPTYDFACPFVDSLEGVTHALRTSEYKDREAQFYWMLKLQQAVWTANPLPHVVIWDYSRLSFIYTVLSKRKLTWFVDQGLVDGWADPRMPTVQGMMRRGLTLPALREFILFQGASKNVTYQEWDKIWAFNKKVIDPVCPRHTAITTENRVLVNLIDGPDPVEIVEVPKHQKYPPAGMKQQVRSKALWLDHADAVQLIEGEEVTLMAWGNIIIDSVHKNTDTGVVSSVDARLHLEGDFKKTKLKLTWLSASDDCPAMVLHHFGYLITKKKLEVDDKLEDFVNKDSDAVTNVVGDINLKLAAKGDVIQLERRGYFIIDQGFDPAQPEKPIVLFDIPDGRQAKVPKA
jgi:glutamyl-tRNA synthetase